MGYQSNQIYPTGSATGTGLRIELKITWDYAYSWQASWEIIDGGSNYKVGDVLTIPRPSGLPNSDIFSGSQTFTITKIGVNEYDRIMQSINRFDVIADYVMFPGMETRSHQDGPEHSIVYVNELINTTHNKASYESLAIGGIRINSAKEWTNFTQLSAYFKQGIRVTNLVSSELWDSTVSYPANLSSLFRIVFYKGKSYRSIKAPNVNRKPDEESEYWKEHKAASNNFAEIAYALLTDENLGAGKLVGINAVGDMRTAAKFCNANGFTWDGMISNKINLREFLHQHATYNLLDFTVIGGRFNLLPSVPYKEGSHEIDHEQKVNVSALFTDGNIKDLKVSFLSPEERQMFQAHIMYRKEKANAFAETKSLIFRLKDEYGGSSTDPIETFDLSGFCTTENHAKKFAKHILKIRKEVDHGISFKTGPQFCLNLSPGQYIRVVSEATHIDGYANGVITEGGEVITTDPITETNASIYYWKPGTTEVLEQAGVNFVTGQNLPTERVLFTLKETVTSNRVYKIETISYSEDGLIEISGSHAPLTDTGSLAILDGWDGTLSHFTPVT
tara:strand:- start:3164 stop:4843 length:1680 start_codon:yes stop_codon:yes gene_type:complete